MLWIKFPASQFFLPINTHPRKHSPVWQAAFIPRTLHNGWNFSGDSLEAPLNVYLALLTVLGQPPAQLWVSQGRTGQSTAGKQLCWNRGVRNLWSQIHSWTDTHGTEFSLSLEKWMWSRISQVLVSSNERESRCCSTWETIFSDSQWHT